VFCEFVLPVYDVFLTTFPIRVTDLRFTGPTLSTWRRRGFDPLEGGDHYSNRAQTDRFAALAKQRHASTIGTLPDDVRAEIDALKRADMVILQFPLRWYGSPADTGRIAIVTANRSTFGVDDSRSDDKWLINV
jgi:hypothetical protein